MSPGLSNGKSSFLVVGCRMNYHQEFNILSVVRTQFGGGLKESWFEYVFYIVFLISSVDS